MITVERFGRIVSRVHILAAGFVNTRQTFSGTRRILGGHIVVRIDVMVIEVERDLKIVCDTVFELFAEIEDVVKAMFLFPARCEPLLEFAMTFRRKVSSVS